MKVYVYVYIKVYKKVLLCGGVFILMLDDSTHLKCQPKISPAALL